MDLLKQKQQSQRLLDILTIIISSICNHKFQLELTKPQNCTTHRAIFGKNCTVNRAVFLFDGLIFEVGDKNKGHRQLAEVDYEKAYVVKDDMEYATMHTIPL